MSYNLNSEEMYNGNGYIGEEDCPITKIALNPLAHVIFITYTHVYIHYTPTIDNSHTFGSPSDVKNFL